LTIHPPKTAIIVAHGLVGSKTLNANPLLIPLNKCVEIHISSIFSLCIVVVSGSNQVGSGSERGM
jgi:hypothetical protein